MRIPITGIIGIPAILPVNNIIVPTKKKFYPGLLNGRKITQKN